MNFVDLIEMVNVHSEDNEEVFLCTKRRDKIIEILKDSNWNKVADDGYLLIFNNGFRKNSPKSVLISCHIDTVFKEGDYFIDFSDNGKTLTGTLDNSASIAILLDAMLNGNLPENTFVSFTGNEESGMAGVRKTVSFFKNQLPDVWKNLISVIVMDVTLENYEKSVSLENFFFNKPFEENLPFNSLNSFIDTLCGVLEEKGISYGVVPEDMAAPDEAWEYDEYGLNVFSLCLPTSGDDCHSLHGITTTVNKMKDLRDSLISVTNFLLS